MRAAFTLFPVLLLCVAFFPDLAAQTATTVRNAHIRLLPDGKSASLAKLDVGTTLKLRSLADTLGHYSVISAQGVEGFVYRTLVRTDATDPAWWIPAPQAVSTAPDTLRVCSFNIKFLGSSKSKEDAALVQLVVPYHLVMVQELVAPPYDGAYPDGVPYTGDVEAARFFDRMKAAGFHYFLSDEDTGKNTNRSAGTSSEWSVAFYRPEVLQVDSSRSQYVSTPLVAHPTYDRVPFAFHFTTTDSTLDFTVINVHLASDEDATAQRRQELQALVAYAEANYTFEKDVIILGDMNIQNAEELSNVLPQAWVTLNDQSAVTNVAAAKNPAAGKPFDHVMYHPAHTTRDLDVAFDIQVVDIFARFYAQWAAANPSKAASSSWVSSFGSVYSDHHPVTFQMLYGIGDDDWP